MKVIGLTGGIASGKSSVAKVLADLGVPVADADLLSREVMQPGTPVAAAIARRWPAVVAADGRIDRKALGAIVFADAAQRAQLTAIVVPRIVDAFERWRVARSAEGHAIGVLEAATLLEEGLDRRVDGVLVVSAPPDVQVRRLAERNRLSADEARLRLAAQFPLEEKVRRARWVLENAGSPDELVSATRALWNRVCDDLGVGRP